MTTQFESLPTELRAATERYLAKAREHAPEVLDRLMKHPAIAASLLHVWTSSEFVAVSCSRDLALLEDLVTSGVLFEPMSQPAMAAELAAIPTDISEAQLMELLRRYRRRHTVRIAWRDIAGWAALDETLRELSSLADVCIEFAYQWLYTALVARYGTPRSEHDQSVQPLIILGMGKLGGRELNFSSDIDLILLYPDEGQTDGARALDNTEFFLRLGQKLAQLLATSTADGFVYRVDLRLRPFGDSGRLALSFDAFEDYLQQQGRDWERYAYVKARAITGVEHYQQLYDSVLRPFVYRRYLDFGVFESLRDMKAMIAREVARREMRDNIKLGPGGIREIEFIVQAFQLIRGGSDRRLQSRELRTVLPLLVGQRLLRREVVADLDAAYRFLRVVENRLQQWNDAQTHVLPEDEVARTRLAFSMQFASWAALAQQLDQHRERVSRHFAQTVFGPSSVVEAAGVTAAPQFDLEAAAEDRMQAIVQLGIAEAVPIAESIEQLRASTYYRRLDDTGRRRLRELLRRLLTLIAHCASPATAYVRLAKIIEMIGGRTVYLALLNENATALQRLVELCAQSQFLADQIAAHPLLLDELIDERLVDEPPSRAQFEEDLAACSGAMQGEDPERQVELLRQFQRAAIFKVAVADLTGRLPLMKVSDRLTEIAELIVRQALALSWTQIVTRHGVPQYIDATGATRNASMIVVGYGKLGGRELGYGSDLDLVFLHDSSGESPRTAGSQSIDNTVFFQRVGQRLVHLLTVHAAAGRLYEVDTRLRPGGNRGLLVQSLSSFKEYEFREAWTWEHQSLLRARAVTGDAALCETFEAARIEVLRKAVRREHLQEEVRRMRQRMRDNLSKAKPGQVDLKQDAGGVADLEFLVQFWMLKWADRYPEIVTFSDNIRQLESLESGNLVSRQRVDFLVDTYRKYRERLHRLSLDGEKNLVDASEFAAERKGVIEIWQEVMGEAEKELADP